MTIPHSAWIQYIDLLAAIDNTAAKKFTAYLNTHEVDSTEGRKAALDYANALVQTYGESAAAVTCEFYDAIAAASGAIVPAAVPAVLPEYGEVAKTVNGMLKQNQNSEATGSAIGRLVKRTGADTTLKNAIRDGAEWAWIPNGDTCGFCITLASRGWQKASRKVLKGDHAEHIHANCDCEFAIRFDSRTRYDGYDPDKYLKIYEEAEGSAPQEKINSIRRAQYAAAPDKYRAEKKIDYGRTKEREKEKIKSLIELQTKYGTADGLVIMGTQEEIEQYQKLLKETDLTPAQLKGKMFQETEHWETLLSSQNEGQMKKFTNALLDAATDEELGALSLWTGSTFGNINKLMRYGAEVDPISAAAAKNIENILSRVKISEDLIVRRGTGTKNIFESLGISWGDPPEKMVGKTWTDNGFVAASPLKNGGFGGPGINHAELFIHLPAETNAAYIKQESHLYLEREMLIKNGYGYQIVRAEYRPNVYNPDELDLKLWVELIKK